MGAKVIRQESKEFQLKVVWPPAVKPSEKSGKPGKPQRGPDDEAIFAHVCAAITQAVGQVAGRRKTRFAFNDQAWVREGIRYDTAPKGTPGILRRNNLTLAIEAQDDLTKLKCKQHHFIPELLFARPVDSICYPDLKAARRFEQHRAKFKREQDLHFSNIKYCASGSVNVPGRALSHPRLASFSRYFPGLEDILPAETCLHPISHWDEVVFDDLFTGWGKQTVDSWMLVNRWQYGTDQLLESELSFKVTKKMNDDWDRDALAVAGELYLALQATGIFQDLPEIFTYANPATSVAIARMAK